MSDDIITTKKRTVEVDYADLQELIKEVRSLRAEIRKDRDTPEDDSEIITTKDVMKDLGRCRKTIDRLMYESDDPLPMVAITPRKLGITRGNYRQWKERRGL